MKTQMDTIKAIQIVPVFKRLYKKGKDRTQAEEKEYQEMLAKNPILENIRVYERYAELMEMSGRSDVQEAELKNVEMRYPEIPKQYAKRQLGKSRSRRHRRLTRRKRTIRK